VHPKTLVSADERSSTPNEKEFRFDARVLVGPPYWHCPKCGEETFGVYHVGPHFYSRRCRNCWQKGEYPLWPLSRKVIYVDQFAISNMMKALNKATAAHSRVAADPFWLTLFEKLDRIVKLQLAICPHSDAHRRESMVSVLFEPLKRMYEQLSHNVSFESLDTIGDRQLNTALLAWLDNKAPQYAFDPERVTNGRLNEWTGRFIISVSGGYPPDLVDGIRKFRDTVHAGVRDVFEAYRDDGNTDFEYWLDHERTAGGRAILQSVQLYVERMREIVSGARPVTLENIYTSRGLDQFQLMVEVLRAREVPQQELVTVIRAFVQSDTFKDYPTSRLSALLWAAIARHAALGQRKVPNTGMMADITVVSTLLPYCDAMFVDNGCRGLWESIPKRYRPSYADKPLFSPSTRDQFLAHLQQIENDGDPAVLSCVHEVYGEPRPFLTMYDELRKHD
jgi:hypothetical protein